MSQPQTYTPSTEFLAFEAADPTFPGQQLDVEFNNLDTSISQIEANLALIQRDDGALLNASVGFDQLTAEVAAAVGDVSAIATLVTAAAAATAAAVAALASQTAAAASSVSASGYATTAASSASAAAASAVAAAASAASLPGVHGTPTAGHLVSWFDATHIQDGGAVGALGTALLALTTLTAHGVLLGNGGSAPAATAVMTDGQLLVGQSASDPLPKSITGDVTLTAAGAFAIGAGKVTFAMIASAALATAAQFQGNTASLVLTTDKVWSAATEVALTDAATITVDMSTFINAGVTLGGNRTLGNPSNAKVGQSGAITITQDGTGSRTLSYASNYKWAGGSAGVLSTAAASIDTIYYYVRTTTFIELSLAKAWA